MKPGSIYTNHTQLAWMRLAYAELKNIKGQLTFAEIYLQIGPRGKIRSKKVVQLNQHKSNSAC